MRFALRNVLTAITTAALIASAAPVCAQASDDGAATAAPQAGTPRPTRRDRKKRRRLSLELAEKGEAELRKSVRVFQQKQLIKRGRLELLGGGAIGLNDALVQNYNVDAGLLFHISDQIAVGVSGSKVFASQTEHFNSIQGDFGLFPERGFLQAAGFAELQYSPIFGKFASFGVAVLQMDAYLLGAGGIVRTATNEKYKPCVQLGTGVRIHLLRAVTLSIEVRDALYFEEFLPATPGGPSESALIQHVTAGAKIGFWIPPSFTYKYQR